MWWHDVQALHARLAGRTGGIDPTATIEPGVHIDASAGPVAIGPRTRVCSGAIVRGPVAIGADGLVGNYASIRGPAEIGDGVRIGYATEIKQALIADGVSIGPQCFVADSRVDAHAYLGAQVRTSNHRLDGAAISVREDGAEIATGMDKLGCWIGSHAALGIQVIVLPGRVVAPRSLFEPRLTVGRNYPTGHYRAAQSIERVSEVA